MNVIKVNKAKLMSILEKNKTNHIKDFQETLEGFYKTTTKTLEEATKELIETKTLSNTTKVKLCSLQIPTSYEDKYTKALGMLEMHTEDTIELDSTEYSNYVDDEWEWTARYKATSSMYK